MSVVDGDELVDRIIAATQAVLGDMTAPDTGIRLLMQGGRTVRSSLPA